jgi:hypothetical protein
MATVDTVRAEICEATFLLECIVDLIVDYARSSTVEKLTGLIAEKINHELKYWLPATILDVEDFSITLRREQYAMKHTTDMDNYFVTVRREKNWRVSYMSVNSFIRSVMDGCWYEFIGRPSDMQSIHRAAIEKMLNTIM